MSTSKVLPLVLGTVFFLSLSVVQGTHKVLAESYGCDADIEYLPDFERGSFMATEYTCTSISEESMRDLKLLQSQTEIIGYLGITISVPFFVLLSIISLELQSLKFRRCRDL